MTWKTPARAAALAAAIAPAPIFVQASLAQTPPLMIERGRIDRPDQTVPTSPTSEPLRGRFTLDGQTEAAPLAPPSSSLPQQPLEETQQIATLAPLRHVILRGSSLPIDTLAPAWNDKIGMLLDRGLIARISAALSELYQQSDIALFTITAPNQDLSDGVLELRVVEGHVTQVEIRTDDRDAPDISYARRLAEHLTQERPLRKHTLERYLSLIRDIPGERVIARLEPARDAGGATLILEARRNRFDGGVGVDNRGTPQLGDTQVSLDAAHNGLLRGGDSTSFLFVAPAEDDLFTYVALGHSTPIGDDGLRLNLSASRLDTHPDSIQSGEAETASASISYPLLRGYTETASLSFGFDALNSENALFGQTIVSNRTRVFRLGLSYAYAKSDRAWSLATSLSGGLDAWGAEVNPLLASADFTKLTGQAAWSRLWDERYALRLRAQAQASGDQLPSSEQMALGGDAYGRAYQNGVIQGDDGLAASAEAAYILDALSPDWMTGSEIYAFADAGEVWLHARPIYPAYDFSLSSAGFGARWALGRKTMLGLELARGLEAPYPGAEQDWRLVYRLSTRS